MKKHLALAVVAACTFAGGCSYSERTTAAVPAPAPAPLVVVPAPTTQQTVTTDSYTGRPLASTTTVTTRQ